MGVLYSFFSFSMEIIYIGNRISERSHQFYSSVLNLSASLLITIELRSPLPTRAGSHSPVLALHHGDSVRL